MIRLGSSFKILLCLSLCVGVVSVWSQSTLVVEEQTWDGASVYVVKADPAQYRLVLLLPKDNYVQYMRDFSVDYPQAQAIINAGFYKKDGRPTGFLKADEWRSTTYKTRGVIGFNQSSPQSVIFDRLTAANGNLQSMYRGGRWWQDMNNIVGGAPLLLADGKALSLDPEQMLPTFVTGRHARSAICRTTSDQLLFVLVQGGDQYATYIGVSSGLTLFSLRRLLQSLDCRDALNLDGGYSSSMLVNGQLVVGHWLQHVASRPIANALAFVPCSQ